MSVFDLVLIAAGFAMGYGAKQASNDTWFDILAGCGLMVVGFVIIAGLIVLEKI